MKVETQKVVKNIYQVELSNGNVLCISIHEIFKPISKLQCDWMESCIFTKEIIEGLSFTYNPQPDSNPSGNIPLNVYCELLGGVSLKLSGDVYILAEELDKSYAELEDKLLAANKYGAISIPDTLEIIGDHIEEYLQELDGVE